VEVSILTAVNSEDDCLAAELRPGNVHSAEGWEEPVRVGLAQPSSGGGIRERASLWRRTPSVG
jgi:hypothetical protein